MKQQRQASVSAQARTNTRARVEELLDDGLSVGQTARRLGISAAAVSYHRRRLGRAPSEKYAPRDDWHEIQRYYDEGHSITQCQERFGFSRRSWSKAVLRGTIIPRPQAMPIESLLVAGRVRGRRHIKSRLLASGLKENRCEDCGIDTWLDEPLNMALHHVNGDGSDNRLENLRLLCANCHSQTDSFARKRGAAA